MNRSIPETATSEMREAFLHAAMRVLFQEAYAAMLATAPPTTLAAVVAYRLVYPDDGPVTGWMSGAPSADTELWMMKAGGRIDLAYSAPPELPKAQDLLRRLWRAHKVATVNEGGAYYRHVVPLLLEVGVLLAGDGAAEDGIDVSETQRFGGRQTQRQSDKHE